MDLVAKSSPKERADIFVAASGQRLNVPAGIMEKDFWVCWSLKRIFASSSLPYHFVFKGGTSLSKVFHIIDRFSEDVDLSFDRRELGFDSGRDPERAPSGNKQRALLDKLQAECEVVIRDRFVPILSSDFEAVLGAPEPGISGWGLEIDPEDPQTVIFNYPRSLASQGIAVSAYISPAVRLELGARSDSWPAKSYTITPYAAELFPQMFSVASCEVNTLEAVRTFWEKATLLHAAYHRPGESIKSERLSRHYFDLYQLSKTGIVDEALRQMDLLDRVIHHKMIFFRSAWAHYETAVPGSFHLLPAKERIPNLRSDYGLTQSMIFGEVPTFDAIMERLGELESRINAL